MHVFVPPFLTPLPSLSLSLCKPHLLRDSVSWCTGIILCQGRRHSGICGLRQAKEPPPAECHLRRDWRRVRGSDTGDAWDLERASPTIATEAPKRFSCQGSVGAAELELDVNGPERLARINRETVGCSTGKFPPIRTPDLRHQNSRSSVSEPSRTGTFYVLRFELSVFLFQVSFRSLHQVVLPAASTSHRKLVLRNILVCKPTPHTSTYCILACAFPELAFQHMHPACIAFLR